MTGQSKGARFNNLLPSDRSPKTITVKLSTVFTMVCTNPKCQYRGHAGMITGRSAFPIFKCPECNRVAQSVRGVK